MKFPVDQEEERSPSFDVEAKTDISIQLLTAISMAAPIKKPLYLFSERKLHRISTQLGFCGQGPIFAFVHLLLQQYRRQISPQLQ